MNLLYSVFLCLIAIFLEYIDEITHDTMYILLGIAYIIQWMAEIFRELNKININTRK